MNSSYIQVKCKTWNRESHGLFDYNSNQVIEQNLNTNTSGSLIRKGNDLYLTPENSTPGTGLLLNIYESNGDFIIVPVKQEKLGLVLNKANFKGSKGFKLSEGDLVRLGKINLRVQSISNPECEKEVSGDEFEGSNAGENTCRVCFRTHTNIIDPLLSICKCSGSMGLTHLKCMQRWLLSKAITKNNVNCVSYCWRSLCCDICKESLPQSFMHESNQYDLIFVPLPSKHSICLKDYRKEKYEYILHVITASDSPILIGRAADTDLKINDISVSRAHASIEFHNSNFYLKDCKSKFGTVAIIKRPVVIQEKHNVVVQIGRSVVTFTVATESSFKKCLSQCCRNYNRVEPAPRTRTEIAWEEVSLYSSDSHN